jgi:hypothetical protein
MNYTPSTRDPQVIEQLLQQKAVLVSNQALQYKKAGLEKR